MKMRLILLTALAVTATVANVSADLVLDLQYSTGAPTTKTVSSGDTVMLDLILRDPSDDNFLSLEGLGSGGSALVQGVPGGVTLTPTGPPVPGAASFLPGGGAATPRPGLIDSVTLASFFPVGGGGATSALIATFSLMATGAPGSTTTINTDVFDLVPGSPSNVLFASFTDLDALLTNFATTPGNFGSVSLSIAAAAIPEPSTMLAGSLILVAGFVCWRRRRLLTPVCDS